MILIDFFNEACCKSTELVKGWYWYEDDGEGIGGPYKTEDEAIEAAENKTGWTYPFLKLR